MSEFNIGDRLKCCRDSANLSLQQVANLVGTSKSHIWEIEKRRSDNPTLKTIKALAGAFGMTVSEFIGEEEPKGNSLVKNLAEEIVRLTSIKYGK